MITNNLSTLKIHKLTQAQYDREVTNGTIDENAIYLTPDEEIDFSAYMTSDNPSGTGSFSMNRKVGSEIGEYSHAEGYSSAAIGKASHAGGEATQAEGVGSFAHGQSVTADADYQATLGTHNEVNANAAFIVGNGANSTSKKNAFEVNKDGNTYIQGTLFVNGTGSKQASAKEVATKEYVDTQVEKVNICTNQSLTSQEKDSARTNIGAQKKITGTPGQFVVIGDDGNVTTRTFLNAEEVAY